MSIDNEFLLILLGATYGSFTTWLSWVLANSVTFFLKNIFKSQTNNFIKAFIYLIWPLIFIFFLILFALLSTQLPFKKEFWKVFSSSCMIFIVLTIYIGIFSNRRKKY